MRGIVVAFKGTLDEVARVLPSHVLVPLDGSPLADDALEHALAAYDCRVTVLNVVTPVDAGMSESGIVEPGEERLETAREHTADVIANTHRRVEAYEQPVETVVETGEPTDVILEYVERTDVDHVVMGGHGGPRGGIGRRLLGTVATTVVSTAPVSVTVVR